MEKYYNRKECSPEITIKNIKKILKQENIRVKESKIINIDNVIYSVRLELKAIPGLGTNGKGITKEYALASAYAELMERIQSNFLLKSIYLNKETYNIYNDEVKLDYDSFKNKFEKKINNPNIMEVILKNPDYRVCTKFKDVIEDRNIDLPIKIINLLTHSNGLCSGNSKEEALVQGICEIMERYCYKRILFKELELPSISKNDIKNCEIHKQLDKLTDMNFEYDIKDCSLGNKYPVIGLIIYSKEKEKYIFTVGSDLNFNIALQRCITEAFQGIKKDEICKKMNEVNNNYEELKQRYGINFLNENWLKCYSSNTGIHPKSIFKMNNVKKIAELPFMDVKCNKDAYIKIIELLKKNKMKLFIKDYSFLGFDTYKAYIPDFSEVENFTEIDSKLTSNFKKMRNLYFDIYNSKTDKILEEILLECSKDYKYSKFIPPANVFNVGDYVKVDYFKLNFQYILILYLLKNKQYKELGKLMEYNIKENENNSYEKEYLKYIDCIINNNDKCDKNTDEYNDAKKLVNNTQQYLKNIRAPSCPNCKKCLCKNKCKYKQWRKINVKLKERYKLINRK